MTDEFYVGYLPLPPRLRRFLLLLVPALIVGLVVVAGALTSQQPAPGDGTWELGEKVTLTGTLTSEPYAMLTVPGEGDAPARDVLLVTMGKLGGEELALSASAGPVTVSGYPIARGAAGLVLLTVETPQTDVAADDAESRAAEPEPVSLGSVTLQGQIIDPKCYFGAMKPGEGKVHKACATLCIRGGIPPMFMTLDESGERTYHLLLDEAGNGITGEGLDALLPYVADPVRVRGSLERHGNMLRLRIDPEAIERL